MELWIPVTLAAAFSQNLRNALQKTLKGRLSTWGATASRFVFAAPLAVLFFFALSSVTGQGVGGLYLDGLTGVAAQSSGATVVAPSYTLDAITQAMCTEVAIDQ